MIILREPLAEGTKLTIENVKTQTKVEARVARPPQTKQRGFAGAGRVCDALTDVLECVFSAGDQLGDGREISASTVF